MNTLPLLFFIISWQVSLRVINRILCHNKSNCLNRVRCYCRIGPFIELVWSSVFPGHLSPTYRRSGSWKMLNIFFKALGTFIRGKNLTSAPQKWWHVSYKMRFKTALYHFHFYMLCHCPNFCTSHHWVTSISNITKMLPRHLFPHSWLTNKGSVDHALKVVCYT